MQQSPLTPAVTQEKLSQFVEKRALYIQNITELRDSIHFVGIQQTELNEGEAELSVLLPRDIFKNEFEEMIKRLRDINRLIRAFSEVATGSAEPIQVHQISTSDPQFFLGLSVPTIVAIGGAITWALATWKKVEEIRNLRAQTRKLATPFSEVEGLFDKKIKEIIETSISEKTDELMKKLDGQEGRAKELRTHMAWALESLLAYVERGTTIEITFKPPPPNANPSAEMDAQVKAFEELKQIAPQLTFPKAEGAPVLSLPSPERLEP